MRPESGITVNENVRFTDHASGIRLTDCSKTIYFYKGLSRNPKIGNNPA